MHRPAPSRSNPDALEGKTLLAANWGVISSPPSSSPASAGRHRRASRQEFPVAIEARSTLRVFGHGFSPSVK
jgi:hypothetical protein